MSKILVYTDAFSGGGAEEVFNIYSKNFKDRGHKVLHVAKWLGPREINLPLWKISLNKKTLTSSILSIIYILKKYDPEIVITTTGHNNLLFIGLKLFFFKRIKVIIRETSIASVMNKYAFKSRMLNGFVKLFYKHANLVIAQSEDMVVDLVKNYNVPKFKIVKLNNPIINNQNIANRKSNRNSNQFSLITIGRLSREKGFGRMIDLIKLLPIKFTLKIIGEGIERKELESKILGEGLENRIKLMGYLDSDEKRKQLAESDLYIQTSFVEGFPNSLLESIYYGIPAIAFNVPGGTSEIINEVNGKLIVNGDISSMKDSILNTNWKHYFKKNLNDDIELRFGQSVILNKLNNIIMEIAGLK